MNCEYKDMDKETKICTHCEARQMYIRALAGDEEGEAYMDALTPDMIEIPVAAHIPYSFKREERMAKYETKYCEMACEKIKKHYGEDCKSFHECLLLLDEKITVRTWMANFLGIHQVVMRSILEAFTIPVVDFFKSKWLTAQVRCGKMDCKWAKKKAV